MFKTAIGASITLILTAGATFASDTSPGVPSAVPYSQEYYWQSGWGPVDMGSAINRVCFLTSISGRFEGEGESVFTEIQGGSWILYGYTGVSPGIYAKARCVPVPSYSAEYTWGPAGSPPIDLGSPSDRVCFFTGVSGRFNSGQEMVGIARVYPEDRWELWGFSPNPSEELYGSARCVPLDGRIVGFLHGRSWSQYYPPQTIIEKETAQTHNVCFLQEMEGKFEGGGERVYIYGDPQYWIIGGYSSQFGVGGMAGCLKIQKKQPVVISEN